MKVAIILYSGTGNTRGVVERLAVKLRARGHQTEMREITVTGDPGEGADAFQLTSTPTMDDADLVVLASPVMAFSLSPVMKSYLAKAQPPKRPVLVVITQHFPCPWMGGRQALAGIRRALERAGGAVADSMIVNWSSKVREQQIEEGTDRLAALEYSARSRG